MRGSTAALALPALLLSLPGCIDLWGYDCPDLLAPDFSFPLASGGFLATDPSQPWDTVVLLNDTMPEFPLLLEATTAADKGGSWSNISSNATTGAAFGKLSFHPGDAGGKVYLEWDRSVRMDDCSTSRSGNIGWELADAVPGDISMTGEGAMVYTAGFWENGTLFYTNIPEVDAQAWPRAGWYAWEGGAPLPVYIYDQDRTEQPAWWKAPSSSVPPTGSPADPIVGGILGGAEAEYGLGYFTTIQGFNEALKGLSTTTTRVVRLAPEEAYTLPGNEEHALYGDAIVFYIKVVEVRPLPCPYGMQDVPCETPMVSGFSTLRVDHATTQPGPTTLAAHV